MSTYSETNNIDCPDPEVVWMVVVGEVVVVVVWLVAVVLLVV